MAIDSSGVTMDRWYNISGEPPFNYKLIAFELNGFPIQGFILSLSIYVDTWWKQKAFQVESHAMWWLFQIEFEMDRKQNVLFSNAKTFGIGSGPSCMYYIDFVIRRSAIKQWMGQQYFYTLEELKHLLKYLIAAIANAIPGKQVKKRNVISLPITN